MVNRALSKSTESPLSTRSLVDRQKQPTQSQSHDVSRGGKKKKVSTEIQTRIQESFLESLITKGDVSGLSPEDKAVYYTALCKSLGLAPASQPFSLIKIQGKEVLYASRTATDQLAAIHKLNREIIDGPKIMDFGGTKLVYAVCRVTHPNGRTETATATLPLADPVNVLMKCETKAKRRATLSILGLGSFDDADADETRPTPVALSSPVEQISPPVAVAELEPVNEVDQVEECAKEYLAREIKLESDEHENLYREFLGKCPKGTSGAAFQAEITRQKLIELCGAAEDGTAVQIAAQALKTEIQRVKAKSPKLAIWGVFVNTARELDLGHGEPEAWCKTHIAPILNVYHKTFAELRKSIEEKTSGHKHLTEKQQDALCYPVGCAFAKRYTDAEGKALDIPDASAAHEYTVNWISALSGQGSVECVNRLNQIILSYWKANRTDEKT